MGTGKEEKMGNKQSLDKKEVDQLTKQTHWTKEDLAALHADFKAADVKKTGELDFSQFVSIMKGRITMDEAGYKNLFTHMDTDNSGTISFQELATNLSVVGKGSADEKLAFTFDLYDDDKSGYLDRQEAEQVLKQMQRVPPRWAARQTISLSACCRSWTRTRTARSPGPSGWRWAPRPRPCSSFWASEKFKGAVFS